MTVGKENVRIWGIKNNHCESFFQIFSIYLGEHARETYFTDVCISCGENEANRKILIVSNRGNLYICCANKKEIVGIFNIHAEPINCIIFSQQLGLGVTTCPSGKLKVWSKEFTQSILEITLESQVKQVDFNEKNLICGCSNGSIGILYLEKKKFSYLVRSHQEEIKQLVYHTNSKKILTISSDFTIKIWEIMQTENCGTIFFQ